MNRFSMLAVVCLMFMVMGCRTVSAVTTKLASRTPAQVGTTSIPQAKWIPRTEQDFLREPVDLVLDTDRDACRRAVPHPTEHVDEYMACLKTRRETRAKLAAEKQVKDREEAERRYEEGAAARQAERDRQNADAEREAEAWAKKQKREREDFDARVAADRAAEETEIAAKRKRCGKYMSPRIGMPWSRVRDCAGPFEFYRQDALGTTYRAAGGFVRVEKGVVVGVQVAN